MRNPKSGVASRYRYLLGAVCALTIGLGTVQAGQQDDQIAVQLGAIQLGYNVAAATPQELANALTQGRAALKATQKNAQAGKVIAVQGGPAITDVQSETFRGQLLLAVERALTAPLTKLTEIKNLVVNLANGKTTKVTSVLNPKKTTASAIFDYASKRIPNFGPTLVETGIEQALAGAAGVSVFNYKDDAAKVKDANKLAGNAMKTALKTYAKGTTNWAGVPATGPVVGQDYLPNFSTKTIPTTGANLQQPDLPGLSNAASAVAASAIRALTNAPGALAVATNYTSMANALVKGAASFQKTSTSQGGLSGGTVAGTGFGTTVQTVNKIEPLAYGDWDSDAVTKVILEGIIAGGVKASSSNAYAYAIGVAGGFAAAYLNKGGADNLATFQGNNSQLIHDAFIANKVKPTAKFEGNTAASLLNLINDAIQDVYVAHAGSNYSTIAGALGVQLPGAPDPVTDTVGL
jgi:hypothetical protein